MKYIYTLFSSAIFFFSISSQSSADTLASNFTVSKNLNSLHFMWVNKSLNQKQLYLLPSKNEIALEKKLKRVFSWSLKLKSSMEINLWYDSRTSSKSSIERTKKIINFKSIEKPYLKSIKLRDIRTLALVEENPNVFSEKISVFFRVDLLRIAVLMEELEKDPNHIAVYSDLDVLALSYSELFNEETCDYLKKFNIVMTKGRSSFENSFQIMSYNKTLFQALRRAIIQPSLSRAEKNYSGEKWQRGENIKNNVQSFEQSVYASFYPFFIYYYSLRSLLELDNPKENLDFGDLEVKKIPYNIENLSDLIQSPRKNYCYATGLLMTTWGSSIKYPTKLLKIPPSQHSYSTPPDRRCVRVENTYWKLQDFLKSPQVKENQLLYVAALNNNLEIIISIAEVMSDKELFESFTHPNPVYYKSKTPLSSAVDEGHLEIIDFFLNLDLPKKILYKAIIKSTSKIRHKHSRL